GVRKPLGKRVDITMARKILIALFVAHAVVLLVSLRDTGFGIHENPFLDALLALNGLAVAGLITRGRPGRVAALLFVAAAIGHYTFHLGVDGVSGLLITLGIAGAILCVTDPVLR